MSRVDVVIDILYELHTYRRESREHKGGGGGGGGGTEHAQDDIHNIHTY